MEPLIRSFPPISSAETRVLILGSMPGVESLKQNQYYAHPRNAFWPIMGSLFDSGELQSYEAKTKLLIHHRVGLWDVVGTCRRPGSLDQAIRDEEINDFPGFFAEHPGVRYVYLNGGKAFELFQRHVDVPRGISVLKLPSTSPAYTIPFAEKLSRWAVMRESLIKE